MEIFFCALTFMFVKTRWNLYPHSKLSSFSMWSFVQKLNGTCEKENKKTKHNGIVTTYEKLYTIMIIFSPPSNVSSNYYNEICNICYRSFIEKRTKWKNNDSFLFLFLFSSRWHWIDAPQSIFNIALTYYIYLNVFFITWSFRRTAVRYFVRSPLEIDLETHTKRLLPSLLLLMKNRIKLTKFTRTQCSAQFTHHVNRKMEQDQWS